MWKNDGHYAYLNTGLTMLYNGEKFHSENGLYDLLNNEIEEGSTHYPVIHLKGEDIEIAMTHMRNQYGESYHSFVNGQHTTMGGTHQAAFRGCCENLREFYGKNYDASDIRQAINAAISAR